MKNYDVFICNTWSTDTNDEGICVHCDWIASFVEAPPEIVLDAIWEQAKERLVACNEGISFVEKDRSLSFHCNNPFDIDDYKLVIREHDTLYVDDEDD